MRKFCRCVAKITKALAKQNVRPSLAFVLSGKKWEEVAVVATERIPTTPATRKKPPMLIATFCGFAPKVTPAHKVDILKPRCT